MPQYIPYNPWSDAANVGERVGGSLSNLMLQLPQIKAQARQRQEQMELERQRLGLEKQRVGFEGERVGLEKAMVQPHIDLYKAQAAETGQRGELYKQQGKLAEAKTLTETNKQQNLAKFLDAAQRADAKIKAKEDPTQEVLEAHQYMTATDSKQLGDWVKTVAASAAGTFSDQNKAMAFGSPQAVTAGRINQNQVNPLLGEHGVISAREGEQKFVPQLGTNVPATFSGPPKQFAPQRMNLGGLFQEAAKPLFQDIAPEKKAEVIPQLDMFLQHYNLGDIIRPKAQVMPGQTNAPVSTNAPTRLRVRAPNGQVGTVSQESLQEALQQGYTPVQ